MRLSPEAGPPVLFHREPGPLVAIRLSAPVAPDLAEGTAELLQELARPAAVAEATRLGAALELRHDGDHAVLAVTGPTAAFDALVAILRRATAEPVLAAAGLRSARARAEDPVLPPPARPGPRLRRVLWQRLYGGPSPTGPAATVLEPEGIRSAWAHVYAPERLLAVVVGDVAPEVVCSAFAHWPAAAAPGPAPAPPPDSAVEAARAEAHDQWSGIAYPVDVDPAVLAVTAELVQRRTRASSLRYAAAEAWAGPGSAALVVIGGAAPGDTLVRTVAAITDLELPDSAQSSRLPVSRYLRRLIAEAAAVTGEAAVDEARTAVTRRLLLAARTIDGKAEVLGRMADAAIAAETAAEANGEADLAGRAVDAADTPAAPQAEEAARRFLARVATVTLPEVRGALSAALTAPALLVEVGP